MNKVFKIFKKVYLVDLPGNNDFDYSAITQLSNISDVNTEADLGIETGRSGCTKSCIKIYTKEPDGSEKYRKVITTECDREHTLLHTFYHEAAHALTAKKTHIDHNHDFEWLLCMACFYKVYEEKDVKNTSKHLIDVTLLGIKKSLEEAYHPAKSKNK